jgi:hypothetical protein
VCVVYTSYYNNKDCKKKEVVSYKIRAVMKLLIVFSLGLLVK